MKLNLRFLAVALIAGCAPAAPPPAAPPPAPPPAPTSITTPDAGADAAVAVSAEPPAPAAVDVSLSTPDYAELVAAAPDGSALLLIHGWVDTSSSPGPLTSGMAMSRGSTIYLAVLDARHECIEETVDTAAVDAAGSTGTIPEALAALSKPAVSAQIHHLWQIAQRFGVHDLGPAAFGVDEGFVVVEANNGLYVRSGGPSAPFVHHAAGTSAGLASSPSGAQIAFRNCGSPCGGMYVPAILDTKTKKVRRFPIGNAHDLYWSKDEKSLVFSYDDRPPGGRKATKVCLGRIDADAPRATTIKCLPSDVYSEGISASSPGGTFAALQTSGTKRGTFVLFEMPSAKERYRLEDTSPIYPSIDENGRVAFDDNDQADFHMRVHLVNAKGERQFHPDARSVGFLPDGSLLIQPKTGRSDASIRAPLTSLATKRCGHFTTWKP